MRDEEREARQILRRAQDHLFQSHLNFGAQHETLGFVDVLYHPTNRIPYLNYVTPRKKTAWVPGPEVKRGLEFLRERDRLPRVHYVEGLFPPLFARSLRGLGLQVVQETPIMVYTTDDPYRAIDTLPAPKIPAKLELKVVADPHGSQLWREIWRNAQYDVLTMGVEPLFVGQELPEAGSGHHVDAVLEEGSLPMGVVRVTVHDESAHITALAVLKTARIADMLRTLQYAALRAALERKATLVFAPGENEQERALYRELGFVDSGSIVCYAEQPEAAPKETDDTLAQPVLTLR